MATRKEVISKLNEMKGFIRGSIKSRDASQQCIKTINNAINLLEGGSILGHPSPLSKHTKKIRELI